MPALRQQLFQALHINSWLWLNRLKLLFYLCLPGVVLTQLNVSIDKQ